MSLFTENYLAIDYGTTHIKGALYQSGPGGHRILRLESLPIVSVANLQEPARELAALAAKNSGGEGEESAESENPEEGRMDGSHAELGEYEYNLVRYVLSFFPEETNFLVNLPLERVYVRDLSIPITNPKQLQEMIPFEVESLIPISLEEAEVQGIPWNIGEESSQVVAFSVERKDLVEAVAPLQRSDSSIRMVSVDAACLAAFVRLLPDTDVSSQSIAQIDIGGRYSIFNVVEKGELAFTRRIDFGGEEITGIIADVLNIPIDEAEKKKIEAGFDLSFLDPSLEPEDSYYSRIRIDKKDYKKILKKIEASLLDFCSEIERSVLSLPCNPPTAFYLSGGAALMPGLKDYLSHTLGRSVQSYPVQLSNGEPAALWATALGAGALYQSKSKTKLDFLNSPFGSTLKGGELNFGMFSTPIMLLLFALIIFLGALVASVFLDRKEIAANKAQLVKIARSIPGVEAKRGSGYKKLLSQIRSVCLSRLRGSGNADGSGVLQVLQELTKNTPGPQEMDFKLRTFHFNGDTVKFDADVKSYEDSSRLIGALKKSKLFKSVKQAKNRRAYNQKLIRISVQIKLNQKASKGAATCK